MGRYQKEFWDDSPGLIGVLTTAGIANIIHHELGIPVTQFCRITDTQSGASAVGSGATKGEASADAWFRLTGKKDEKYKQNEEERRRKKEEWEKRQRDRERKQKEWEQRQKEHEKKKVEWEQRQKERERKKAEWERKQKEWEHRKKEQERKKAEWEQRQRERERKKAEWEQRQRERERKKAEWEQRQREREQRQREWEQRQRERERKKSEWEARKAENERRRQEYEERKRSRGNRGGGSRRSSSGGCFITTATCQALNKGDDCLELNLIRDFRDNWLSIQKNGLKIILDYYHYAPLIVDRIEAKKNKKTIYRKIWTNYLNDFFQHILLNNFEDAKRKYLAMVRDLKITYLP